MRLERRRAGDPVRAATELRDAARPDPGLQDTVREIVERVRAGGDAALAQLTERFDTGGAAAPALRVEPAELDAALAGLDSELRAALELAAVNVRAIARTGVEDDRDVELPQGQRVRMRALPVRRAAVYAPGGRAPYPSTVLMGAVTAREAGVEQVVVCAPPGPDGAHPTVLGACALCGVDEVYRVGGAQAIAALAYGTESIAAVDVIVGPGNAYVQEAKRQIAGRVGIDGYAGPSELLVLLDDPRDAPAVALDLLAQAEHGPDSVVVAASASTTALDAVAVELESAAAPSATARLCALVDVSGPEEALAFAEALAPEHLQLIGAASEALAPRVRSAGCLFVGRYGATAFGDYVAGSNHVLPTAGAARFASALSPRHFRRRMAEVRIDAEAAAALAPAGAAIARAEGFVAHAQSMEARIRENGARDD